MKKTILALAFAAGLTSFAGSAKAQIYSLTNTMPSGAPEYISKFTYSSISIGDVITFDVFGGSAVGLSQLQFTTYNTSQEVITGVWSAINIINDRSMSITCEQGSSGFIESNLWPDGLGTYKVTDPTTAVKAAGVAVKSTDVIPEPSTYALFGIGATGLLMVRRRQKTT